MTSPKNTYLNTHIHNILKINIHKISSRVNERKKVEYKNNRYLRQEAKIAQKGGV